MKKTVEKNGFTLIELIIVVSILAIAVGVTSDVLINLVRSYNKSQVSHEVEQNANFVGQKLVKELRNATVITDLDLGDLTPLQQGDHYNEVTFLDSAGNEIIYSVLGGIIFRNSGSGDEELTENNPPYGIDAACPNTDDCFTLLSANPQVLRISIIMTQAGTPGNRSFEGEINIEDTIVIRNTY